MNNHKQTVLTTDEFPFDTHESIQELAQKAGKIGIFDWDVQTNKVTWTRELEAIYGLEEGTFSGEYDDWVNLIHPDYRFQSEISIEEKVDKDSKMNSEFKIILPSGEERWIEARSQVFYDKDQHPVRVLGINMDITESKNNEEQLKASLKEKEILLKEIHHRVKNNLQIISSLLSLQSSFTQDKEILNVFKESQNRIKSIALVHERLYQSKDLAKVDFGAYIRNLAANLFSSYGVDHSRIELHLVTGNLSLGIDIAVPCGLMVNELLSNAVKYAFPDNRQGKITIIFKVKDDIVSLYFSDDGVGLPPNIDMQTTKSLGLQLVSILTDQLEGTLELDRKQGTKYKITFKNK